MAGATRPQLKNLERRPIDGVFAPLVKMVERLGFSAVGGMLMIAACAIALTWANSSAQSSYLAWLSAEVTIGFGPGVLSKPAILWINDLLMAMFFLLVGLEIKREVLGGELSSLRKAALPVTAAVGGVAIPALVYFALNTSGEAARGWAIPAATDIAFALGLMALLGKRVPLALKVFLTTVAVVDDIVAVLIIAVFYTSQLSTGALLGAGVVVVALVAVNRLGVERSTPYLVLGAILWVFVLKSGVHATIAGVLLAFCIPARSRLDGDGFETNVEALMGAGEEEEEDETPEAKAAKLRAVCNHSESLLLRWEHALAPWVLMLIMPVFALANAGVILGGAGLSALTSSVGLGVGLGLLLGKPIGITLAAVLAVRFKIAERPSGVTWLQLHGAGWLAGIGFTMSLFVADLAFKGSALLTDAKLGLLAGSALAAVIGITLLVVAHRRQSDAEPTAGAAAGDNTLRAAS